RIVAVNLDHAAEPAVETDEELPLVEFGTRFVTINLTLRWIRSNAVRRKLRNRTGKRRIDVASTNHVSYAQVEEADEHGHVAWQLSLNLSAQHPHSWDLDVRIDQPGRLLSGGDSGGWRERSRTPPVHYARHTG